MGVPTCACSCMRRVPRSTGAGMLAQLQHTYADAEDVSREPMREGAESCAQEVAWYGEPALSCEGSVS
jgi:hypothetical protein